MDRDYEALAVERIDTAKSAMGENRAHLLSEAQVWATLALAKAIEHGAQASPAGTGTGG